MRFKNKLHYTLKYFVLGLPVILYTLSILSANIDIYNEYTSSVFTLLDELRGHLLSSWYFDILSILQFDFDSFSALGCILMMYPLYIFWVYMFDLFVDIITWLLRLFHDMLYEGLERSK